MNLSNLGIIGFVFCVIITIVAIIFAAITASCIATAIGVAGLKWWIVAITMFLTIGGLSSLTVRGNDY